MKIANIEREILHIFWTTLGISMTFSGNMWLMIILKATKNQGSILSLEDAVFKKPQVVVGGGEEGGAAQIDPRAFLGLRKY